LQDKGLADQTEPDSRAEALQFQDQGVSGQAGQWRQPLVRRGLMPADQACDFR
jgi:hypothetical protein